MDGVRWVGRALGLLLASFACLESVPPAHAVQFTYSGAGGSGTPGWVDAFTVAPGSTVSGTVSVTLNQGDSLCNPGPFLGGSGRAQCEGFWNDAFVAPTGSSYANGAASISGFYGGTIGAQRLSNGTFVPYQPQFGTVGASTLPYSGYVLAPSSSMNGYDLFSKTSSGANQTYSALQVEVATSGNTTISLDWNVQSNTAPYGAPAPLTSQAAVAAGLPVVSGSYWAKPGPLTGGAYLCNGPCPTYTVTPPPTVQQLAALAGDAYSATPQGGGGFTVLQANPPGVNGFGATAYVEGDPSNGGQIVIAARGTSSVDDSSHAYSTLADASYVSGTPNFALQSEVIQFGNFVSQIAQAYPSSQVTLTGYSLGGGIAQIVGNYAKAQTVTFLAPGSAAFVPSFSSTLDYLGGLNILSPSTGIYDYRQLGDLISLVGTQVGTEITLQNPALKGFGGPVLEAAIYGNFLTGKGFHSISTLFSTLASQPTTPGMLGPLEQVGAPDSFVTKTVHYAVINGALATFVVPNVLASTIEGFDPGPGYGYSLVDAPGSPEFASLDLPVNADAAGWALTFYTDGGQAVTENSFTGDFSFGQGVNRLDFNPLDALGNPIYYPDPFIFGLTFDSDGNFDATLTTDTSPLGGPGPTNNVPEPGSILVFCSAFAMLGLLRRPARSASAPRPLSSSWQNG